MGCKCVRSYGDYVIGGWEGGREGRVKDGGGRWGGREGLGEGRM